jgi:ABC-type transport system involved in cytochrome bd biosynthesis fused ATPase/permease subunit
LLGAGAGLTGYLALQARDERRAELNQRSTTAADLDRAERRTKNLALTTDLLAGSAIVCAGIATTLIVVHEGSNGGTSVAVGPDQVWLHGSF